jgi:hypothetical protein
MKGAFFPFEAEFFWCLLAEFSKPLSDSFFLQNIWCLLARKKEKFLVHQFKQLRDIQV